MRSTIALSLAALTSLSAGQATSQYDYPYRIDPNSVSTTDRAAWCQDQRASCPLICLQQPGVTSMTTVENDCDIDTLLYSCICEDNKAPNITQYSQTLPFYICRQWGIQCVANCGLGQNTCADKCRADHPCGAQQPFRGNTSIPSTSSARATPSGTSAIAGFNDPLATGSTSPGKGAAVAAFVPSTGLSVAALCGSVLLGFAVFL